VQIYKKNWRISMVQLFKLMLIFWVLSFGLLGCYKKKETILQVNVRDISGTTIKGAKVELYADPTDTSSNNQLAINFSEISNEDGTATFNLNEIYKSGQTGVAIIKAKATYYNKTGQTIIQITEEVLNECFVEIK
jgi:hypothetical protein